MKQIRASLVIPLFNSEKTLLSELNECKRYMEKTCNKYEIIVSDDKSNDLSPKILKTNFSNKKHFRLIYNKKNIGIGANLYKLYHLAKYNYIILYSVDGDWNPKDIERLLKFAYKENADIVIGKRIKKNYGLYREMISFFYNFLTIIVFGVNTIDAASIKVIKRKIIKSIPVISKSVFLEAELIIKAKKNKMKILSLPISFNRKSKGSGAKITYVISSFLDLIMLRLRL